MAIAEPGRKAHSPRDAADVVELLRGSGAPVEPCGRGSKRTIGSPGDAELLDLSALAGVLDYEPAELVLSARASTPLGEIQRELAEQGQRLAFEPPDFSMLLGVRDASLEQTLGGVLSANLAGSRRIAAGAARDHFLGFRAVTGDGIAFEAGGRVVKNVTGYDLPKLLAGAWGTLAVLTEVTVRVAPVPETETTLVLAARDAEHAVEIITRALTSPFDVSSAAFDPEHGCALRIEGFARSVDGRIGGVLEALGRPDAESFSDDASRRYWNRIGGAEALAEWPFVVRVSVPPSHAPHVVAALAPGRYLLDWAGGLIWAAYADLDDERLRAIREALRGGHATLWKAPRRARGSMPTFPPQPPEVAALCARVKAALDPAGRLSPGRLPV